MADHLDIDGVKSMRVLQVITHLDLGGAESVAISLAEELRDRIEPSVFAVMRAGDGPVSRSMVTRLDAIGAIRHEGTALPFKRGGLLQAGLRLAGVVRSTRPDLVHLHTELPEACWAVASQVSSQVRATPVLRTVHNVRLWPEWRRIGYWVERRLGDRHAAAVSDKAADGLVELRTAAGLPPTPAGGVEIILNGVRPPQDQGGGERRGSTCRILFAGRLEQQKGADLLPEIWEATRALTAKPAELTVMGTGSLEQTIRAAFHGDESVRMIPPAPGLAAVLGNYDTLLMPSRFEGLTLVAVEAAMAGLPVIGFQAPGLRDIFPDHYGGLAGVEDVPALARLLADAIQVPGSFLDAATRRLITERFGLDRMAGEYAEAYARLAAPALFTGENEPA